MNSKSTKRQKRHALWMIDKHCAYCQRELTFGQSTLDHVIPLAEGGSSHISNLVLACERCNQKKGKGLPKKQPLRAWSGQAAQQLLARGYSTRWLKNTVSNNLTDSP